MIRRALWQGLVAGAAGAAGGVVMTLGEKIEQAGLVQEVHMCPPGSSSV
ncbi:hypothetical protein [Streptomyces sp. A244]|nr:hypothetical protein [Streptomyces sp. A244]